MGSTEQPPPPRTVTIIQDGKTIRMWLEPPSQDEAAPEEAQAGSPDDPRMLLAMLLSAVLGTTAAPVAATLLSAFGSLGGRC